MIAEYPQDRLSKKIRQGLALPLYAIGLLMSYATDLLAKLAAWIAGDDWPC